MSLDFINIVLLGSLLVTILAYLKLSSIDGSYINVLLPSLVFTVPAYYFFPSIYMNIFGNNASPYAFAYIYSTLAVENVAFVYGYSRGRKQIVRLPIGWSYHNFVLISLTALIIGVLLYLPILLQFRQDLLDPRRIYEQTRTGFGLQFYVSSFLAYIAIILILFAKTSRLTKGAVVAAALGLLLLHGSKGQVLSAVLLLILFHVYGAGKRVGLGRTLVAYSAIALVVIALFAGSMFLGDSLQEMLETISEYSDYTRNAMMVIDEHFPLQYGRLTIEANTIALIPRALIPNKRHNLGGLYLDEEFYPQKLDADAGAPAFGIGLQYADFGDLAVVYLGICSLLRGWLARVFVNRLNLTHHPADFFMVAFFADVGLFPVGSGWFLAGAILVALLLRRISTIGAERVYWDRQKTTALIPSSSFNGGRS